MKCSSGDTNIGTSRSVAGSNGKFVISEVAAARLKSSRISQRLFMNKERVEMRNDARALLSGGTGGGGTPLAPPTARSETGTRARERRAVIAKSRDGK